MASKTLTKVTMESLMSKAMRDQEEGGAVASNYLNLFALTALAYVWTHQARLALKRPDEGRFYETKLKTARYFFSNILPEIHSLVAIIEAGKASMMAFSEEEF